MLSGREDFTYFVESPNCHSERSKSGIGLNTEYRPISKYVQSYTCNSSLGLKCVSEKSKKSLSKLGKSSVTTEGTVPFP